MFTCDDDIMKRKVVITCLELDISIISILCQFSVFFISSHPEVFLGKGVLKICSKVAGEHTSRWLLLFFITLYLHALCFWILIWIKIQSAIVRFLCKCFEKDVAVYHFHFVAFFVISLVFTLFCFMFNYLW